MEELHKQIIAFIEQFYKFDKENAIKLYTEDMSYWFAIILYNRFKDITYCIIAYNPVSNHFCCMIDIKLYDITGEITDDSIDWYSWSQYQRLYPINATRVYDNLILKLN